MDDTLKKDILTRLGQLPKVVQEAITSADIEKRLQELANTNKLYLDQWEKLEKEVMLTLLGFKSPADLEEGIKKEVGVDAQAAAVLTDEISRIVFEPIRQELERELEHPEAKAKEMSGVETAREQTLSSGVENTDNSDQKTIEVSTITPATPSQSAPTEKAIRMPTSGAYVPGETSIARKDVHDDPYREPPA